VAHALIATSRIASAQHGDRACGSTSRSGSVEQRMRGLAHVHERGEWVVADRHQDRPECVKAGVATTVGAWGRSQSARVPVD
jgi:hypothetical protein